MDGQPTDLVFVRVKFYGCDLITHAEPQWGQRPGRSAIGRTMIGFVDIYDLVGSSEIILSIRSYSVNRLWSPPLDS